jgi:hypothetical protein
MFAKQALKKALAWHWWLTPVILVTQEAEIRRIVVQSQLEQIVQETQTMYVHVNK